MNHCACGCGGEIVPDKRGKIKAKFIRGHNARINLPTNAFKKNTVPYNKGIYGKQIAWNRGMKIQTNTGRTHFKSENMCGVKHPRWKGGMPSCPICGKKLSTYTSIHCDKCNKKLNPGTPPILKGKNNFSYGKPPIHGKRIKYKQYCFRSTWEAEFAKFLDSINEPWTYESKTFELENTTYTPDFYLSTRNLWIEIKGWWRPGYKEKFEAFLQKYPEEKIKLIIHKPPYTVEDLKI